MMPKFLKDGQAVPAPAVDEPRAGDRKTLAGLARWLRSLEAHSSVRVPAGVNVRIRRGGGYAGVISIGGKHWPFTIENGLLGAGS